MSFALGKKKEPFFFSTLLSFFCSIEIQRWPLLSIESSKAIYQSVSLNNTLKDFFSSFQFRPCFVKERGQRCQHSKRELRLHTGPALDAASIAHLPAVHFVLSFGSFLGGCVLMNCCNDFVKKSGQHRLLALVYAFRWPMQLICGVRLNDSWLLYYGCRFIS